MVRCSVSRDVEKLSDTELSDTAYKAIAAGIRRGEDQISGPPGRQTLGGKFFAYAERCFAEAVKRSEKPDPATHSVDKRKAANALAEDAWWRLVIRGDTVIDEVEAQLRRALRLDQSPRIYAMMAEIAFRKKGELQDQLDEAAGYVTRALELDENLADLHWLAGQIAAHRHQVDKATEEDRLYLRDVNAGKVDPLMNYDPKRLASRVKATKDYLEQVAATMQKPVTSVPVTRAATKPGGSP